MLDPDKLSDLAIACKLISLQLPEGDLYRKNLEDNLAVLEQQINHATSPSDKLLESSNNLQSLLEDILQSHMQTRH